MTNGFGHEFLNWHRQELPSKLFLGFGFPRSFSSEHFVVNDSQGPNVAFEAVFVIIQSFGRHVDWAADIVRGILFRIGVFHGEPKIGDFDLLVFEEYVGRLEISVDDAVFRNVVVPVDDLAHQIDRFSFRYRLSARYVLCEVPFLA